MAGYLELVQRRTILVAALHAVRTARVERASMQSVAMLVLLRWDADVGVPALGWVRHRDRVQQELAVRMPWILDRRGRWAFFGDRPAIQDVCLIADLIGGAQIVGNVEERNAEVVAHAQHDLEDHCPQRRINHRHRLVGDDQTWTEQERSRRHGPLALAATQLGWVPLQDFVTTDSTRL